MIYYITTTVYYKNQYALSNKSILEIADLILTQTGKRRRKCTYALKGDKLRTLLWEPGTQTQEFLKRLNVYREIDFFCFETKEQKISVTENSPFGKIQNYQLSFAYKGNIFCEGVEPHTIIQFGFSSLFEMKVGVNRAIEIIDRFYDIASDGNPVYGFTDVATPKDTNGGICFGPSSSSDVPYWRIVENNNWYMSGFRKENRVRGLYWANLFGDEIVKHLGGVEAIKDNCVSESELFKAIVTGGRQMCIVKLSKLFTDLNPMSIMSYQLVQNLNVLQEFLGKQGALNAW